MVRHLTKTSRIGVLAAVLGLAALASARAAFMDLLVADTMNGRLLRYDGVTGAYIGVFGSGITNPIGVACSTDGSLVYAADTTTFRVYRYSAKTGALLEPAGLLNAGQTIQGVTVAANGDLLLGTNAGRILRYTAAGVASPGSGETGANFSDNLNARPRHGAFGGDGNLYVSQTDYAPGNKIYEVNGTTGNLIATWASVSTGSMLPEANQVAWGPSFNAGGTPDLYASIQGTTAPGVPPAVPGIWVYEGTTGLRVGTIDLSGIHTTWNPRGLAFSPYNANELIVVSGNGQGSRRFRVKGDGTYADLGAFLTGGSPGARLESIAFFIMPEPGVGLLLGVALAAAVRRPRRDA